jgi:hypothetical protein
MAEAPRGYEPLVLRHRLRNFSSPATRFALLGELCKPDAEGDAAMNEQVIVGEAVAGRAATVRRNLMSLVTSLNVNEFDLAELFHEAQEHGYYAVWGYASLADYAAQELGLKERKAQYLANIVRVMKAVGLKRENYEPAGKSKLREIAVLKPESSFWNKDTKTSEPISDHIVRLVLDHDKLSVKQTHEEVLRLQGRLGPDRPTTRSYTVPRSAYDNVIKPAFELIRMRLGSQGRDADGNAEEYKDGAVLECICAEVLADPNNQPEDMEEVMGEAEIKIPTEGQ